MKYRKFQGSLVTWQQLFREAAEFATTLGPAAVHSISHSASASRGIVVVWYREGVVGPEPAEIDLAMKFFYKRGTFVSWEELFNASCDHAAQLQPEQVVSFSHSDTKGDGIAALWYWDAADGPSQPEPPADSAQEPG